MWIVVESGLEQGRAAEVANEVLIGSAPSCDLSIQGQDVFPRHALARAGEGMLTLTDLGTPAGTFLNGERLSGPRAAAPGDRIRIGDATFEVTLDAPTPGPATAAQVSPPPPATPEPAGRRRGMVLAGVVIVLLVCGVAVALAVSGGSKTPVTPKPAEPEITTFTASAASPIEVALTRP